MFYLFFDQKADEFKREVKESAREREREVELLLSFFLFFFFFLLFFLCVCVILFLFCFNGGGTRDLCNVKDTHKKIPTALFERNFLNSADGLFLCNGILYV